MPMVLIFDPAWYLVKLGSF